MGSSAENETSRILAGAVVVLFLLLSVVPAAAATQIVYVDIASGADLPGGGSAGSPWQTISYALSQVTGTSLDPVEMRIAQGTYTGSVIMETWTDLLGGYQAGTWLRDVASFETRLDGAGAFHVVTGADNARLDGFTITGGNASGVGNDRNGAGIYCNGNSPEIANNIIAGNQASNAGAAVWGFESSLILDTNIIVENVGVQPGSAVYVGSNIGAGVPTPLMIGNVFVDNQATSAGGVLRAHMVDLTLSGNRFVSNLGWTDVVGARGVGGLWSNNEFVANDGDGLTAGFGPLVFAQDGSTFRLVNNTLWGEHDGGLFVDSFGVDSQIDAVNNIFMGHATAIEEDVAGGDEAFPVNNLFFANTVDFLDEALAPYTGANNINLNVAGAVGNREGHPLFLQGHSLARGLTMESTTR